MSHATIFVHEVMSRHNIRIEDWLSPLKISSDKLCSLACRLSTTYSHLALHSDEQFLATPVTNFPSGKEQGEFLAIDLGGTNLRIAFVTLLGTSDKGGTHHLGEQIDASMQARKHDASPENIQKKFGRSWPIDDHLKAENAEDLFNWVGDCLAEVVRARFGDASTDNLPDEIPLGITFSFPMMYVRTSNPSSFSGFLCDPTKHLSTLTFHFIPKPCASFPSDYSISVDNLLSLKRLSCRWAKDLPSIPVMNSVQWFVQGMHDTQSRLRRMKTNRKLYPESKSLRLRMTLCPR